MSVACPLLHAVLATKKLGLRIPRLNQRIVITHHLHGGDTCIFFADRTFSDHHCRAPPPSRSGRRAAAPDVRASLDVACSEGLCRHCSRLLPALSPLSPQRHHQRWSVSTIATIVPMITAALEMMDRMRSSSAPPRCFVFCCADGAANTSSPRRRGPIRRSNIEKLRSVDPGPRSRSPGTTAAP